MKPHVKIFLDYHGYSKLDDEYIPCAECNAKSVDIHHRIHKSQGGGDNIENLVALCRDCHTKIHV